METFEFTGHGASFFRQLYIGIADMRLLSEPYKGQGFCHLALPGELVKAIPAERLRAEFGALAAAGVRFECTRIDLAFDTHGFLPSDVLEAHQAGDVRSLAKRDKWTYTINGEAGATFAMGARSSDRYLRVYLHEGPFTRVELECKDEKAQQVFLDLLMTEPGQWPARALGHLRDFVDFKREWWAEFCQGAERAHMKLSTWAAASFNKTRVWLEDQVSASLAIAEELLGFPALLNLLELGRGKWKPKHLAVMSAYRAPLVAANG